MSADVQRILQAQATEFRVNLTSQAPAPVLSNVTSGKPQYRRIELLDRRFIAELRPNTVAEVAAMVALYRPGPMAQIPRYIRCKLGMEKIEKLGAAFQTVAVSDGVRFAAFSTNVHTRNLSVNVLSTPVCSYPGVAVKQLRRYVA